MDPDDIASQQKLLAAHRRTLAIYLRQLANLGADYAPPGVHNGIRETRAAIATIKAELRAHGVTVEDISGDEAVRDHATPPRFRIAVQRMVDDYTAVFGGRDAQLAALNAFLEGDKPYALLIAPTGRGKTALLIHWLAQVRAAGSWHVIFAPLSLFST